LANGSFWGYQKACKMPTENTCKYLQICYCQAFRFLLNQFQMSRNDSVRHGDSTEREGAPQGFLALHSPVSRPAWLTPKRRASVIYPQSVNQATTSQINK
jgi:hypothetical protein